MGSLFYLTNTVCHFPPQRMNQLRWNLFRRTVGTPFFDHKRNEYILEEMKVEPVDQELRRYKSNLLRHVTGMNSSRMAKTMLNYRTNGRRRLGTPLKRLLDATETGLSRPNSWRFIIMMTTTTTSRCFSTHVWAGPSVTTVYRIREST